MCGRARLSSDVTLPRGVPAEEVSGTGRPVLRVEKDPDREAALCDRAQGRRPEGACDIVGEQALAPLRRTRAQLRDRHHGTERIMRGAA